MTKTKLQLLAAVLVLGGTISQAQVNQGEVTLNTIADLDLTYPIYRSGVAQSAAVRGFYTAGDWGAAKLFRYDSTNALSTNAIRRSARNGVGRWVHDWDGDVQAFGVKADGVTDDTVPIQLAADEATARGLFLDFKDNRTYRITGRINITSGFRAKGYSIINCDSSLYKWHTNSGVFGTPNAVYTTNWSQPLSISYSNIIINDLTLTKNWPSGGTNVGPLLVIDNTTQLEINRLKMFATNNYDWLTFIRANNVRAKDVFIRCPGSWSQDGWHYFAGTNAIFTEFDVYSGDDAMAIGGERDQTVDGVVVANSRLGSQESRGLAIFQATFTTLTPIATPTNYIQNILIDNVIAFAGQKTNYPAVIEEYDQTNNVLVTPPRVVRNIKISNSIFSRGNHTNSGNAVLGIKGTDNVEIENCDFYYGNYNGIALDKTKNTKLIRNRVYRTVRDGSLAGGSAIDAYNKGVEGLTIAGGYYEAAPSLHTIALAQATRVEIRDATIVGQTGKFGIFAEAVTNFIVANNQFSGPQAIKIGNTVRNGHVSGNVFDELTVTNRIEWNSASNVNFYVEDIKTLYPGIVYPSEIHIGSTSIQTNAILSLTSTNRGFAPPRMSTVARDAIGSPSAGLELFDTGYNLPSFYNGTAWRHVHGWPNNTLSVNSAGSATFQIFDSTSSPVISASSNSWPMIATMYGGTPGFGARLLVRRSRASGAPVVNDDDLGGIMFAGTYTNNVFTDGDAGIIGRTTVDWTDVANGAELVFSAQPTGAVSRLELFLINADYSTGQLPILIRKADATYKRIGITNVGGNETLYLIP